MALAATSTRAGRVDSGASIRTLPHGRGSGAGTGRRANPHGQSRQSVGRDRRRPRRAEKRREDLRGRRILAPQISLSPEVSKNPAKFGLDPRFEADKELLDRQKKYVDAQAEWDRDDQSVRDRTARIVELVGRLRDLKGVTVVCSSLLWLEGHPVDGSSPLSRWFDDRKVTPLLWFQSAGNARGQA
jgi:hypothetical protein